MRKRYKLLLKIAPFSVRDVQYLLDFANFYKIFIKDYSKIAAPLTCIINVLNTRQNRGPDKELELIAR
jgi:hypothetical protein